MTSRHSRRAVLAGSLGLALSACTGSRHRARPVESRAAADPDLALRAAAATREHALLEAYDAAATTPALRARLAPLRAEHAVHLQALATTTASPSVRPATPSPSTAVTPHRTMTFGQLAALEGRTAAAHAAAAIGASPQLAPVLASLAASEASHAAIL